MNKIITKTWDSNICGSDKGNDQMCEIGSVAKGLKCIRFKWIQITLIPEATKFIY